MKRYIEFALSMADNGSGDYTVEFGLGDWCPPNRKPDKPKCPVRLTDTAYFYIDSITMAKCAKILGNDDDATCFTDLAVKIKKSFRERFVDPSAGILPANDQTSISCAIYQGLLDDAEISHFGDLLVDQINEYDRHIDCGILGTKYLMNCLTDLCKVEYAYDIAAQTTFPSWGNWIEQGATTLWETWNGDSSLNHHMFSDISAWFYKALAGINPDPDMPGFKHIILTPNPVRDLKWVRAHHDSPYGRITSNWTVDEGVFTWTVAIPANTTATVYLPAEYSTIVKGPVAETGTDKFGRTKLELRSGDFTLVSKK
jgi:alpha-L-rhamnosidase